MHAMKPTMFKDKEISSYIWQKLPNDAGWNQDINCCKVDEMFSRRAIHIFKKQDLKWVPPPFKYNFLHHTLLLSYLIIDYKDKGGSAQIPFLL